MATETTGAPSSGVGLLGNGSQFIMPAFGNMPWFGYASLADQMKDAQQAWTKGAGIFAGNNVPKFNAVAGGAGVPPSFAGGFANMPANVGGAQYGKQAYSGGFDPFRGRGLLPPGPGGQPPSTGTPPPTSGPPTGTPPAVPPPANGQPPGGLLPNPNLPPGTTMQNAPTAGPAPYPNTWAVPQNSQTIKTASGQDVPNPFGLTQEQIYWALSGHPHAITRLMESLGAAGGQTMQNGQLVMSPQNQLFHQIVNYYESGGGGFNGGGYTAQDAFNAAKNYAQGMGETTYAPQQFAPGLPMFASLEEAKKAGYV